MLSKLIEAYFSIGEWSIAFTRFTDAKSAGLISDPDELARIYTMIFTMCQGEKSPCIYIAGELRYVYCLCMYYKFSSIHDMSPSKYRYELEREGIPLQGPLGKALLQCCITSNDYSACAEVVRQLSLAGDTLDFNSLVSVSRGGF